MAKKKVDDSLTTTEIEKNKLEEKNRKKARHIDSRPFIIAIVVLPAGP